MANKKCDKCGKENDSDSDFCGACGAKITGKAPTPGIIDRFREAMKGTSPQQAVDAYFDLLGKIEECKKKGDFKKMLMHCQLSLPLLEPLIQHEKIVPAIIPAIEISSKFLAVYGMVGQLKNLKEIVETLPELAPWKDEVESAFVMKDLASKIYTHVKEHDGCLQKDLKAALDFKDGYLLSNVVYYMDLVGKIERRKTGKTYSLSIKINEPGPIS